MTSTRLEISWRKGATFVLLSLFWGLVHGAPVAADEEDEMGLTPFTASAEMTEWARDMAPPGLSPDRRVRRLAQALLDGKGLGLEEVVRPTLDARQAFRERRANCVSYAALLVALARHEGLPVFFVRVGETGVGGEEGEGLRVNEGHLAVGWRWRGGVRVYDFAGETNPPARLVEPLTDLTALALFWSNRGVEAMLDGEGDEAVRHLEAAVELDPLRVESWTNLGVARRRAGDLAGARRAYETALAIDPTASTAYRNLATLLRLRGRTSEADEVLEEARRMDDEGAFDFLRRAHSSLEEGDLELARGFYRKALELSGGDMPAF